MVCKLSFLLSHFYLPSFLYVQFDFKIKSFPVLPVQTKSTEPSISLFKLATQSIFQYWFNTKCIVYVCILDFITYDTLQLATQCIFQQLIHPNSLHMCKFQSSSLLSSLSLLSSTISLQITLGRSSSLMRDQKKISSSLMLSGALSALAIAQLLLVWPTCVYEFIYNKIDIQSIVLTSLLTI